MGSPRTVLELHHVIEQRAASSSVIEYLEKNNLFDINQSENLLYMPTNKDLAQQLDISPHNGRPLGGYSDGLTGALQDIQNSSDFAAARSGDAEAGGRVANSVRNLIAIMKAGIINGDLYTNTPLDSTRQLTISTLIFSEILHLMRNNTRIRLAV